MTARADVVKAGRRCAGAPSSGLDRPRLDDGKHAVMLQEVGDLDAEKRETPKLMVATKGCNHARCGIVGRSPRALPGIGGGGALGGPAPPGNAGAAGIT